MRHLFPASLLPVLLVLTGCALTENQPIPADVAGSAMQGSVFGGQQPVTGSTVSIIAMGTSGYGAGSSVLATTTTDSHGNFNFATGSYTCPFANTPVYLTAKGGNSGFTTNANIMLAAGIGPCSGAASVNLNLNEVSTAATAYALSHFFTTTLGASSTDSFGGPAAGNGVYNAGLVQANNYTIPSILSIASGTALPSTATVTREAAKLNTIANIIAACVNSAGGAAGSATNCGTLFTNTTPPANTSNNNTPLAPTDTLQAAVQMALYPYKNVSNLFTLAPATSPFIGLSSTPNDLTIGISFKANNLGLSIRGGAVSGASSNIDIDSTGHIWFPTNAASAHGVAQFDPTSLTFNGPYATGLIDPQYVTVDNANNVFGSDLAQNQVSGVSVSNPTGPVATHFLNPGATVGPIASTANATLANALVYAVTESNGSTALWVDANGNQGYQIPYTYAPTGIAPFDNGNPDGYIEVEGATSGASSPCLLEGPYSYQGANYGNITLAATSGSPCASGGAAQLDQTANESVAVATTLNQLCSYLASSCFTPASPVNLPEGVAIDGDSNLWIANSGNASITTLLYHSGTHSAADYQVTSPVAYIHNSTNGNTLVKPYGIAIDGSGNVWVSNAGCVSTNNTTCTSGSFILSELIGAGAPTITPIVAATTTTTHTVRPSNVAQPHIAVQQNPIASRHQR